MSGRGVTSLLDIHTGRDTIRKPALEAGLRVLIWRHKILRRQNSKPLYQLLVQQMY